MFDRIIAAGTLVTLSASLVLSFSPATAQAAGYAGWSGYTTQSRRPQFRPWQPRTVDRSQGLRWRPPSGAIRQPGPARYPSAARQPALLAAESRYPAPVTRAFARPANVGVRFRPNGRSAPAGRLHSPDRAGGTSADAALQAQFRPKPSKKHLTYEQLQARSTPAQSGWRGYNGSRYLPGAPGTASVASFAPLWGARW